MIIPGRYPIEAARHTPFDDPLTFRGIDLTGAVMKAQVRVEKDGGEIKADLDTVLTPETEGLYLVSAGLVDGVMTSEVRMWIDEATMKAMTPAPDQGEDVILYWDLHITPAGGVKQVYLYGTFTVLAGVVS